MESSIFSIGRLFLIYTSSKAPTALPLSFSTVFFSLKMMRVRNKLNRNLFDRFSRGVDTSTTKFHLLNEILAPIKEKFFPNEENCQKKEKVAKKKINHFNELFENLLENR